MNWIQGVQRAIDYVEENITEEIDFGEVAKQAYSSSFHFQRVFGILCGFPVYRHSGIGNALLNDALDKAKKLGCRKIKLSIVEENTVLRKWYESYGFIHTGTEKFDFFPFTCGYMEKEL